MTLEGGAVCAAEVVNEPLLADNERYTCTACSKVTKAYELRCPSCKKHNSFIVVRVKSGVVDSDDPSQFVTYDEHGRPIEVSDEAEDNEEVGPQAVQASKVKFTKHNRLPTGLKGVDSMLNGGVVQGQVTYFTGDPGVGKSTMLMEMAVFFARMGLKVFHADAEEPKLNVIGRAKQVGATKKDLENLFILDDADYFEDVLSEVDRHNPDVVFCNSINEYVAHDIEGNAIMSEAGDPLQMKRVSLISYKHAHKHGRPWFIVAHVNAEGDMAGATKVRHRGDAIFTLKKDDDFDANGLVWMQTEQHKNRFGNSRLKALFEMVDPGRLEFQKLFKPERGGAAAGVSTKNAATKGPAKKR